VSKRRAWRAAAGGIVDVQSDERKPGAIPDSGTPRSPTGIERRTVSVEGVRSSGRPDRRHPAGRPTLRGQEAVAVIGPSIQTSLDQQDPWPLSPELALVDPELRRRTCLRLLESEPTSVHGAARTTRALETDRRSSDTAQQSHVPPARANRRRAPPRAGETSSLHSRCRPPRNSRRDRSRRRANTRCATSVNSSHTCATHSLPRANRSKYVDRRPAGERLGISPLGISFEQDQNLKL
jgi:hypothetical protein